LRIEHRSTDYVVRGSVIFAVAYVVWGPYVDNPARKVIFYKCILSLKRYSTLPSTCDRHVMIADSL
jgi:hypothetical protein